MNDNIAHVDVLVRDDRIEEFCKERGICLDDKVLSEVVVVDKCVDALYDYIFFRGLKRNCCTVHLKDVGVFVNRTAYKLNEILQCYELLTLVKGAEVLDLCGSPGGFCDVLLCYGVARVVSVSLKDNYFSKIKSKVELKICDIHDYEDNELYDFVLADGANDESYKDDSIFECELKFIKNLKPGGTFIIKHNNYFRLKEKFSKF